MQVKKIQLSSGISQKVFVCDGKELAFAKKESIYVNKDFFKLFSSEEQKAVIYHERHHISKVGLSFLNWSIIFAIIGSLFLISFIVRLTELTNILIGKSYFELLTWPSHLFICVGALSIFTLLRWILETMCDANAIKNVKKSAFKDALAIAYGYRKRRNWLSQLENNYMMYVPRKLRFKIIDSWD